MKDTPFPSHPAGVVALSPDEFIIDTDRLDGASLDAVCTRFIDDANRALVWVIRFQALKTLSERADMTDWFRNDGLTTADVCAVAARFELNDQWEFDPERFCTAVDALITRRLRHVRT